jgi:methyl-accepting chemotaxis protein
VATKLLARFDVAAHVDDQVNRAVSQMDEVTQQNAAPVEQAAAAANSLEQEAQTLSAAVAIFRTAAH